MVNVLEICREYSKDLVWWEAQSPEHQAVYFADFARRRQGGTDA